MPEFTHLHLHSEFSLLDGACRIKPLVSAAKAMGMTSLAVTDHGAMFGAIDFYKECKKQGIKPILGCEVYVAARTRFDKVHGLDNERYHLVLLAENETGYRNLMKLVSDAWTQGFYTKPRVDRELLEKYHEGIIALSACLAGEIPRLLAYGDYERAKETALWYRQTFGANNYFLEIQNHGIEDELRVMPLIKRLSAETGIPLVATNDTHYIRKEDAKIQQILICIQTNHILGEDTGLEFSADEFYLKSAEEMTRLFADCPQAIENTARIAERCNVEIEFGNTKLPNFDTPNNQDHFEYFSMLCHKGFKKRYGDAPPREYAERLEYELGVINKMGYTDYYLIVYDFVRYAKSQGIPVGPGRGSGAGSIAAYCIGITGIDPMKYNLLFERFLNPERVSMPDFDIDFCYERRHEVIDYVISKYGSDHVSQIVTFGTLAAKAAVRDVGRVMGLPYATVDSVAKLIPFEMNITLEKALSRSAELRKRYESDSVTRELIDNAMQIEGMPRHASKHAAGVVITRDPVKEYVPLALSDDFVVTQFTMTALEELGLLKMDFLGLKTLTVISDAEKAIKELEPSFNIEKIPLDDKATYNMFAEGQTLGVFQFESAGMRSVLMRLKPEKLEDLIAVISLYRPGPMDSIDTYIRNRRNPEKTEYKSELLKPILEVTSGCLIYQEQVMQVFRELAGYSYGRADVVRRAMSKKKHDVMEQERVTFIEGAKSRGVDPAAANSIFEDMSSFASYAFNKSHAAAYSLVAYRTAYLKCHYPQQFAAALLTSVLDQTAKVVGYINECERLGIKVYPPDVNISFDKFVARDNTVLFGLLGIKNLGRALIKTIVDEREENGKYTSFYTFCKRIYSRNFNRRAVESLIYSGALDSLGLNRRQMLLMLPSILSELEADRSSGMSGQLNLFSLIGEEDKASPDVPNVGELPQDEKLLKEKEVVGFYVSGHPMNGYQGKAERLGCAQIFDLTDGDGYKDNETVSVLGIITSIKKKITKNNAEMAFVTVEDTSGNIEVLLFPKTVAAAMPLLQTGNVVLIKGRLSLREDKEPSLVCERISPCPDVVEDKPGEQKTKRNRLFLRVNGQDDERQAKAINLLSIFEGNTPVYFYYNDIRQYSKKPLMTYVNKPLMQELEQLLGAENVVFQ